MFCHCVETAHPRRKHRQTETAYLSTDSAKASSIESCLSIAPIADRSKVRPTMFMLKTKAEMAQVLLLNSAGAGACSCWKRPQMVGN